MQRNKVNTKETQDRALLVKSANTATRRAKKISVALDLSIKIISKGELIEQLPNGEQRVIRKIKRAKSNKKGLVKGSTLCLK